MVNKRIPSIILSLSLMLGMCSVMQASAQESEKANSNQEKAVKFIKDMNLVSNLGGDINEPIHRGDFAEIAVKCFGYSNQSPVDTIFTDVKSDDERSGYISLSNEIGLFKGYSDGRFEPNGTVSYEQLLIVLTRMTGHSAMAEAAGGETGDYYNAAKNAGIIKGMPENTTEPITIGEAAYAIKKALDINILTVESSNGTISEYKQTEGVTLLTEKLNLTTVEGQVTADYFTSLAGTEGLDRNEIEVNREVYVLENSTTEEFLGHSVILYLDEETRLVKAIEKEYEQENEIEFNADKLESVSGSRITYKNEEGHTEKVKYSEDGYFVYNGRGKVSWSAGDIEQIYNGTIKLIDSDDDDEFDVIIAKQYEDAVVKRVSKEDKILYFETDIAAGGELKILKLDEEDIEKKFILTDDTNTEMSVEEVEAGSVVSISRSEATDKNSALYRVVVSKHSIEGICKSIDEDKITIDGASYPITSDFYEHSDSIVMGETGTFYLNFIGNVIGVGYNISGQNYAYLIRANYDEHNEVGEVEIEVLTDSGVFEKIKLAEKVRVNDEKTVKRGLIKNNSSLFTGGKVKPQLIIFEKNELEEITRIYTAADGSAMSRDERQNVFSRDAVFDGGVSDTATRYVGTWRMFAGQYMLAEDCKVFMIPEDVNDRAFYGVYAPGSLTPDAFYGNVQLFDEDSDGYVAAAVLPVVKDGFINQNSAIGIVTDIQNVWDDDISESITELTILSEGSEKKLVPQSENLMAYTNKAITDVSVDTICTSAEGISLDKIEKGDVVRFNIGKSGKLMGIEVMFRRKTPLVKELWPHSTGMPGKYYYYGTTYSAYAPVSDVISSGVRVELPDPTDVTTTVERMFPFTQGTRVLMYNSENDTVTSIPVEEISPEDSVYAYATSVAFKLIVIYR